VNFGELIARVRTWRATSSTTEADDSLTYIKDTINGVYKELLSQEDLPWQEKEIVIELDPEFTDGYLIATNGLNVVTLHDTTTYTRLPHAQWGGKMQIGNAGMYYIVERGAETTTAFIYLDRPYQGVSTSSAAYSIYSDLYPLPHDLRKIDNVRLGGSSGYPLLSKSFSEFDRQTIHSLRTTPSGDPTSYSIWKRRDEAWFQTTATVTNGQKYIDLQESTTFYGLENWHNRCVQTADGARYRVRRQNNYVATDPVQLELDKPYAGSSATSTVVKIDPRGTLMLQLDPPPTSANTLVVKYIGSDYDMVNDADEPLVPHEHHDAIWKGAIYLIAHLDGEMPSDEKDRLYRDWVEARQRMEQYRGFDRATRSKRRMFGGRVFYEGFQLPDTIDT